MNSFPKVYADNCKIIKTSSGDYLIIGEPKPELEHNCDQMGCPSAGPHFLGYMLDPNEDK
jgi:hypothetical protein